MCGYISGQTRATHLNPPDGVLLSRADKLIVLSHKAVPELAPGGSTAAGLDVAALQQRLEAAQPPPPRAKAIVVVGWTGPTADLVSGLCDFAALGTEVRREGGWPVPGMHVGGLQAVRCPQLLH